MNHQIRSREVFIIGADGKPKGVMKLPEALGLARDHGLDLVEVVAKAKPPVCKIIDSGRFRFEMAKKEKEGKKNNVASKLKELKLHMNIDPHDYEIKLRKAERFLWKGMKVKFSIYMRGRERMHKDYGVRLMERVRDDLINLGVSDVIPRVVGKNINMFLNPLPAQKRVRKFTVDDEDHDDDQDDSGDVEEKVEALPKKVAVEKKKNTEKQPKDKARYTAESELTQKMDFDLNEKKD